MKIYDISLVVIRSLVAMDFARALASFAFVGIRFAFMMPAAFRDGWLSRVELATWLSPIEGLLLAGLLLMFSKPMARFAARFATAHDAASNFQ